MLSTESTRVLLHEAVVLQLLHEVLHLSSKSYGDAGLPIGAGKAHNRIKTAAE
jgi:hypothetical protein